MNSVHTEPRRVIVELAGKRGGKAGFDNSRPSSVHSEHSVDVRGRQIWSQSILANFRWMAFEIRSQKCNFSQVLRVTVETGIIQFWNG